MQPIQCGGECDKGEVTGIGVVAIPILDDDSLGEASVFHTTCFEELLQQLYKTEMHALFQIGIGPVSDIWAGMNTESDEQAGITEN